MVTINAQVVSTEQNLAMGAQIIPDAAMDAVIDVENIALVLGAKKKKKSKKVIDDDQETVKFAGLGLGSSNLIDANSFWPDYTYEEMLSFIPEMAGRDKKRFAMHRPEVQRAGSKKSAIVNFIPICNQIKREPKHVLQFLLCELGTDGSIDGTNSLIVKGRHQEQHIESIFSKYAKEYIQCRTCKGYDTDLVRDQHTRLMFVQCRECSCRSSVLSIRTGYVALVGKRRVLRAKEESAAGLT